VAESAVLEAVDRATAGAELEVFWIGPDGEGDSIAIIKIGSEAVETSVATASSNPAVLQLPADPGEYMLHYMSGPDQISIGRRPVSLE
jgi:Ca-activated chloride channel family protein